MLWGILETLENLLQEPGESRVPEKAPEKASEKASEKVPEKVSEKASEKVPEKASEKASEKVPENNTTEDSDTEEIDIDFKPNMEEIVYSEVMHFDENESPQDLLDTYMSSADVLVFVSRRNNEKIKSLKKKMAKKKVDPRIVYLDTHPYGDRLRDQLEGTFNKTKDIYIVRSQR